MVFFSRQNPRLNKSAAMSDKIKSSKAKAGEDAAATADPADVAAIEEAALARVASGRAGRREAAVTKLNPAFDSWLEGKLNKIFDTASTEPLPLDLVKLLEKIDQADAAKKK